MNIAFSLCHDMCPRLHHNFTYEARSIHYNKDNQSKGIYGNATSDEISELREEGIETEVIPWFNENEN